MSYRGEDVNYLGGTGDLTLGAYVVHRVQQETNRNALVADAYVNVDVHGVIFEAEVVGITGGTAAIALPGAVNVGSESPLQKDCLLYTSPGPRDGATSRMPSSA